MTRNQMTLTVDKVYKRIQQAREILQKHLISYLSGLDDFVLDFSHYSNENASYAIEDSFSKAPNSKNSKITLWNRL